MKCRKVFPLFIIFTLFLFQGRGWSLSFEEALEKVFRNHPWLQALQKQEKAVKFRARQAARLENPELSFAFEDVFGTGEFGGTRSLETTIEVAQRFSTFGKRNLRREVALVDEKRLEIAFKEAQLRLFRETARAFTAALYAQKKVKLYGELFRLSQQLLRIAEAKFAAGKIPETEKIRAEISAARTRTALENAQEEFLNALDLLGRLWNGSPPAEISGDFFRLKNLSLKDLPQEHPLLENYQVEMERLRKEMALSKAEALPDITVSAGVRWFNESNERAFVLGLSLPLPLWNRNQDQIAALRREITAAKLNLRAKSLTLNSQSVQVKSALVRTLREIENLEKILLPRARDIYRRTLEGYRLGKMEFLRVLDAQRTLFELRLSRLEAYRRYHELRAEALYLLARPEKNFL